MTIEEVKLLMTEILPSEVCTQLMKDVCKDNPQLKYGPVDSENIRAQESFPGTVGQEDRSLRIIKRTKKPDMQIYQPGRLICRLLTKPPAGWKRKKSSTR